MLKKNKYLIPFLLMMFFAAGLYLGKIIVSKADDSTKFVYPAFKSKVNEVLKIIERDYVDTVDIEKLEEIAVKKIVDSLDPHSFYIPSKKLKAVNEPLEGKFSGIGIQFNMQKDTIVVIKPILNGPSEKLGIQPGDRIITINDTNVAGVNFGTNKIVSRLKGPKGTKVDVGIKRKGINELLDFTIVRDDIPLYSVDAHYMVNNNTAFIKISNFSKTTVDEFNKATDELINKGMKKLILDLRGNGGGFMSAAIQISDQFLEAGKLIVYTEGRNHKKQKYFSSARGRLKNTEVVALIDEFSASASEILSGALQDNDRGTIIGRRSYGKGLVQQQLVLSDKSALRITIAKYYTPTGRCIQKPYNGSKEDYYKDINERYTKGEFFHADSINFPDSLKYKTPEGKIVYGGGGIMPDIFVPQDTTGLTDFYSKVLAKGLIYKYAFKYADNNRQELSKLKTPEDFNNYLGRKNIYKKFVEYLIKQKEAEKKLLNDEAAGKIEVYLKAYIARNIIDSQGFYPLVSKIDHTFNKGLLHLNGE